MAFTWEVPLTGERFGPGFLFSATSDVSGPFEVGSYWEIELTAPANENLVGTMTIPYISNSCTVLTWWNGNLTQVFPIHPQPAFVTGEPAQIRVTLIQPTFGVADTDTLPVEMDMQTGQTEELKNYLRITGSSAGRGLTLEEHNAVLQTNVGVIAMAGIDPLQLVGGLAEALSTSAPLQFGSLGDILGPLTGDGTLASPPSLRFPMGVYWVATTIPEGLGHRHGQSEEYPARLVQWRTTHVVGAIEMCTEVLDATTHRELWRFKVQSPHAVEYSVLPGVEIFARYWLFP